MSTYRINGGTYQVDDAIQGEGLQATLQQLADFTAAQNHQKFRDFIGKSEGADYNTIVGGKQVFTDYSTHPNIVGVRTADGPSTAAGKYQITGTTYQQNAAAAGVSDFSPASQDTMADYLIAQKGAADDVSSGNFNAAISKLGGVWASLPSSQYGQAHRSQAWVDQALGQTAPTVPPPAGSGADSIHVSGPAPGTGFDPNAVNTQAYPPATRDADPSQFDQNPAWLQASRQLYAFKERKQFTGSDADLAEYAKGKMGAFANNLPMMTLDAHQLADHGTQPEKEAFLYLMDQYDNTAWSGEGFKRGVEGVASDPMTYAGLGTLGTATIAKIAAATPERMAVRKLILTSLGRTGIHAGIIGGVQSAVGDIDRQSINVSAGRQDSINTGAVLEHAGVGAVAGVGLGTTADALLSVASPIARKALGWIGNKLEAIVPDIHIGNLQAAPFGKAEADAARLPADPAPGAATAFTPEVNPAAIQAHVDAAASVAPASPLLVNPADAAIAAAEGVTPTLPRDLAGAKPRWKTSDVSFDSDIDKALFITSQAGKSKRDADYRAWLNAQGFTDEEIAAGGQAVRDHMKLEGAKLGDREPLHVTEQTAPKDAPTAMPEAQPGATPAEPLPDSPVAPADGLAVPSDASSTSPISTILTQDDVDAATSRAQKGRLWSDDLPHDLPLNETHANALDIPEQAGGLRHTAVSMSKLTEDAGKVADQLRPLGNSDLRQTLEVLRESTTLRNVPVVWRSVQILHDEVRVAQAELLKRINREPSSPLMQSWLAQSQALEARAVDIGLADDAMGSFGGSLNRQRQEGLIGLQGQSVEGIMAEKGVDKATAEKLWAEVVSASQSSAKAKAISAEYEQKVADALAKGDFGSVAQILAQKRRELAGVAEEAIPHGSSFLQKLTSPSAWLHGIHDLASKVRELFISNLFSVPTLVVNAVPAIFKTLLIPVAKAVVSDPLKLATRVELGATYSGMGSTLRAALEKAVAGYKYEQAILTHDTGRLMEVGMAMTGKVGGALRFFPRLLTASDEFLATVNYVGYVAGKAANKAVIEGTAEGLTGKALADRIASEVQTAKAGMYAGGDEAMLQPIVNKGVNLGLTGDALQEYVERGAKANGSALGFGSDEEALTYARDVLYKRAPSGGNEGDGFIKRETSALLKAGGQMINSAPELSLLVGQLFWRTPFRVFEEGIRLTPGVQILAPGFMRDLAGSNGVMRQVRAQSESLVAVGFAGAALALYAQGRVTASGVYMNAAQEKVRRDGPGAPQNSVVFKDGTSWSYNRLDIVAIPMKILINAFEGWDELNIKEAQEQYINQPARRLIMARISVATMAIAQAFKDSNLIAGLQGTINFGKELADPEGDEAAIIKKVGNELGMLVPNTLHKIAQMNDPRLRDPATYFQAIETRLGHNLVPSDSKTSFAYDALGEVRSPTNVGTIFNMFSQATPEVTAKGHSDDHNKVMLELDRLAQVAGATFTSIPVKNPLTGSLDLRTMMTKDGTETMFDRWNRNFRDLHPDTILAPIAAAPLSEGTYQYPGEKAAVLQQTIRQLQAAAFARLLNEEDIRARLVREATNKSRAMAGLMDYGNVAK